MKQIFAFFFLISSLGLSQVHAQEGEEPRFPGCEDALDYDCADMKMLQFLFSNLKHPQAAKDANVQGTVVASFTVKADGSISAPSVKEGLGHGCDEEVIRLINLMPKWIPGTDPEGNPIDMEWEIDVKFKN